MPGKAVGRAAVDLPWLCPNTDSLIALADAPASLPVHWLPTRHSPSSSCGLLRPPLSPTHSASLPGALNSAALPEMAAAFLAITKTGVLPQSSFALGRVRQVVSRAAEIASAIADETRLVPANRRHGDPNRSDRMVCCRVS